MLLRSSSTPVLGSLISSFSETPNNIHYHHEATNSKHQMFFNSKLPCLTTVVSCNSSPISSSLSESSKGIRRAQSDGNLELVYTSNNEVEHFTSPGMSKKLHSRRKSLMLETIPSFSLCNLRLCDEEDDDDDGDDENEMDGAKNGEESAFGFGNAMENMALDKDWTVMGRNWNVMFEERKGGFSEAMHLARGLGLSGGGGGNNSNGGSGGRGFNSAGGDGDLNRTEEYYKKMVKENPGNSLFLRNYAQFLYQTKQDLEGAKEYYWRAMLADPNDGEILSQYAKLVWELHRDQDRASNYFERAVQAAPEDSHVHAAYASFLWEIEEDEDECFVTRDSEAVAASLQGGAMVSAET